MTTNSEVKGYKYIKKIFPEAFIHKVPDFKQTNSYNGGLPDYLVISLGYTYWFEIKKPKSNNFLSIKDFTNQQLITFKKMINCNACVYILIVVNKKIYIIDSDLIISHFENENEKIDIKTLERADMKW